MHPHTDSSSDTPDPKIHRIIDLSPYQEGSIVSRTLLTQKNGSVTFFAFDEGQELSEHTTPFDALLQVIHGKSEITIDGKPYHLEEGDMIVMPADHPHAVKAVTPFKMLLTMILP